MLKQKKKQGRKQNKTSKKAITDSQRDKKRLH